MPASRRPSPRSVASSQGSSSSSRSPTTPEQALLEGAQDYEQALANATPEPPRQPLAGRSLHPLHRRDDGNAEGRPLATGGHLRGGPRRPAARATPWTKLSRAPRSRRSASCQRRRSCTARPTGRPSAFGTSVERSSSRRSRATSTRTTSGRPSSANAWMCSPSSATPSVVRCSISWNESPTTSRR